jgi:maltose O-acetyltransferase
MNNESFNQTPVQGNVKLLAEKHNLTLWKIFCLGIYYAIARHLPGSPFPGAWLGQQFRRILACQIFEHCGQYVCINVGAKFGTGCSIRMGENSSLGADCCNDTWIGNDVMMARDVIILSNSRNFDRTDILVVQKSLETRIMP